MTESDVDDDDEQWIGLRELFTEEPLVQGAATAFELSVCAGVVLRVQQDCAAFTRREGFEEAGCSGVGADAARVTGALLWDSSVVLARLFSRHHSLLLGPGARVLELGAGLGLCGLAAAAAGYQTFLTDRPEVLPLTCSCLADNAKAIEQASGKINTVQVLPLMWGDAEAAASLNPPFDCILMADCIYELESIPHLVACLLQLSSPETRILCAYDADIGRHAAYAGFDVAVASAGFAATPLDPLQVAPCASLLQPLVKPSVVLQQLRLREKS